jgi:hypothetical protein
VVIPSALPAKTRLIRLRSIRRIKAIKADIISRYGGKWDANLREGWLPLVPLYNTGTATFTLASRTVTGSGTTWTTLMKGRKITLVLMERPIRSRPLPLLPL